MSKHTSKRIHVKLRVPKMTPYKTLLAKADAVFSRYIRERDKWTCVVCGSKKRPQCGHLIKRGKHYARFDEFNCNCQCSSCNWLHNEYPEAYTLWFLREYGVEKYAEITKLAYETPKKHKFSRKFLEDIIEVYGSTSMLL